MVSFTSARPKRVRLETFSKSSVSNTDGVFKVIRRSPGNELSTKEGVPDIDGVGGTIALNFVNTLRANAGIPLETLNSDADVRVWMKQTGIKAPYLDSPLAQGALLQSSRKLREVTLALLEQKKVGKRPALTALNQYLGSSASHLKLRQNGVLLELQREYSASSAEQYLAPLADAIALFFAEADFSLIRQCEGTGCVLWFSGRKNGRVRRFCMEETCGTRMRVAAHRARLAKSKA